MFSATKTHLAKELFHDTSSATPELGISLPGMTIVCGDSHTSTHGALGALGFGIGTSEVELVLATQTLLQKPAKNMLVRVLLEQGCLFHW